MPDLLTLGLFILLCVAFALVVPRAVRDLAAQVRQLRKGATPARSARGGYAAVRQSPGHRNFGIPRQASEWPVLEGQHPGLTGVARHVLGDH